MNESNVTILIVEDEIPLLNHIHRKIEAYCENIQIIGKAFNGKEALALIEQNCPDLVLTDIRMPVMDGIELTRTLYEKYPMIKIVILSGFDEFEYVRSVLNCHVQDYLLKPVNIETLQKTLEQVRTQILLDRTHLYEQYFKSLFLPDMQVNIPDSILADLSQSHYTLCLFSIGLLRLHPNVESSRTFSWKEQLMENKLSAHEHYLILLTSYQLFLLIIKDNKDAPDSSARSIYLQIQQLISNHQITFVYHPAAVSLSGICSMYGKLLQLLTASAVIGHSAFLITVEAPLPSTPAILPQTLSRQIQTVVLSMNLTSFEKIMEELFISWASEHKPQIWISKMLTQILHLLQQLLLFSDSDHEELSSQIFQILESQEDLLLTGRKISQALTLWMTEYSINPSALANTLDELELYIAHHYREPIPINSVLNKYPYNASYLTRAFKKQKGRSPSKLINSLRIIEAMKLLNQDELSIKEISEMLGYTDQHYFSRCFKNCTGQSPQAFRAGSQNTVV